MTLNPMALEVEPAAHLLDEFNVGCGRTFCLHESCPHSTLMGRYARQLGCLACTHSVFDSHENALLRIIRNSRVDLLDSALVDAFWLSAF
jgi:hypothetical protein